MEKSDLQALADEGRLIALNRLCVNLFWYQNYNIRLMAMWPDDIDPSLVLV